ncbi:uncharacterized protein LOC120176984 [Hibiscus syriacus]|uniref:uncharacterized protein LOC120176984 n=1 Tax=Hibiscus syriacus TaxID=106335 RepID=UPI001924C5AB|nr:uncharacterized protein LOC120176984 [Hibiscus syriacus]
MEGSDWVAKSNPGAWLILRPDALRPESWLLWGKMSCRVHGENESSKPSVQLTMRHVTCIEDAAIFMALTAAVDHSFGLWFITT